MSSGINKLTTGKDTDIITAANGSNTIKAGNGANLIKLQGGKNTVITGKDRDEIVVSDPYSTGAQSVNVIKTGSGAGVIFGSSGGVCEAALRTAYYILTGKNLTKKSLVLFKSL